MAQLLENPAANRLVEPELELPFIPFREEWTDEALMALPEPFRYELMDGELIIMQPAGGEHGWVSLGLAAPPATFVYEHKLGRVFDGQTGFRLHPERKRGNVLSPDCAFVPWARLPEMLPDPRKFPLGAPDFAYEVLSPDDTYALVERKKDKYFAHDCRLLWIADPRRREVHVWIPAGRQAIHGEDATLDGGDVLPGFTVTVRRIFE